MTGLLFMIQTKRLLLRRPTSKDVRPIYQCILNSITSLQRWMVWSVNVTLESTQRFVESSIQDEQFAHFKELPLVMQLNDKIIGMTGFNQMSDPFVPYYEIGYWIDDAYSGLGLTTEAVVALTQYAFEKCGAKRVQICCQAENKSSIRVAEKAGFTLEARLKSQYRDLLTGDICDRLVFRKLHD
jgi:RimJ/RimL family protein N-acetyltransferase